MREFNKTERDNTNNNKKHTKIYKIQKLTNNSKKTTQTRKIKFPEQNICNQMT